MSDDNEMHVIKRSGEKQEVSFDKILRRIKTLGKEAQLTNINYSALCLKVIDQLYDGIPTSKLDELASEQCASMNTLHYDYGALASRISISNLQKNTCSSFFSVAETLFKNDLLASDVWSCIENNRDIIEERIDFSRDYLIDYFGFKTLERAYLMRVNKVIQERPQHMWMRVALGIHSNNVDKALETYDYMSRLVFTHATPTLFNAGTLRPQLSSCFLLTMQEDSIEGIYDTLKDCAMISKWAGGIGLDINKIRSEGSHIKGTNGSSNGIVPMLRVFNSTARYVDQGGGKRQGSFAIYIEPHHSDIEHFLELRKNHGDEELKARDLFYGLWISDYFMQCVENDADWYLFCPNEAPGLSDVYGDEYITLFKKYVDEGVWRKKMKARDLWFQVLDSQMETGTPYMLYKDACNSKSNQKNLGIIKSSNLCTEIVEYTAPDESAVCNLASIALSQFVNEDKTFNYDELHKVAKIVTENLNRVIDVNYYPTEKTRRSNLLHRPIGIGVQGLADAFFRMDIAFTSDEAKTVNKLIFETIYHAAVEMSNQLAIKRTSAMKKIREDVDNDYLVFADYDDKCCSNIVCPKESGMSKTMKDLIEECRPIYYETLNLREDHLGSYATFTDSPASRGELQFDLWGVIPSERYDWNSLKESIKSYGMRNSLLIAPMPTASTSQILGNNEAFEPMTSNIYSRRTNAGEFTVINKYLMRELIDKGLWSEDLKNNIIRNRGSIQQIDGLSEEFKEKYKIVWEMPMRHIIDMAADRGAFICQSQSMNLWLEDPNYNQLTAMHFHAWKSGLKTGIYYLRRKPKHQVQQFTIEPDCVMCSG
jgi:ribonucleoside-diphosphate reductase alpha subunit